jgi:hypothetical protein
MNYDIEDIRTLIFCDETKFEINNGDPENAIYYLGVAVSREVVRTIETEWKQILLQFRVQASVFHASDIFKEKRARSLLMQALTRLIIENRLICFCSKYPKDQIFEQTKALSHLNSDYIDFNNKEFQAFFYFISTLNGYLTEEAPDLLEQKILLYCDRNVYGVAETDQFSFSETHYKFKKMVCVSKADIGSLALPDFLGYIFRKSKLFHNKVQEGNTDSPSELTATSFRCMVDIAKAGLFKYLELNGQTLTTAINILAKPGD